MAGRGTFSSTAHINSVGGNGQTYYTVTMTQEDGSTYTRNVYSAEEALKLKENWESGKHKFLKG